MSRAKPTRSSLHAAALPALAVVGLLLVAGCAAPFGSDAGGTADPGPPTASTPTDGRPGATTTPSAGDPTPTPAPTTTRGDPPASLPGGPTFDERVPVNGTLGPNATRVLGRVEFLTGTDVPTPNVTVNRTHDTAIYGNYSDTDFYRFWGVTETDRTARPAAYVSRSGNVTVLPRSGSEATVERLLAHEFAHLVQYESEVATGPAVPTIDRATATRAALEGAAVYVSAQYTKRYHPDRPTQAARFASIYERGPAANRHSVAPYHFGYRYVAWRLDSPRDLAALYADLPTTTEQVLHPGVTEGPTGLDATAAENGGEWTRFSDHRRGELALRVVLRGEFDRETAARAAAGWGSDRTLHYTNWSGGRAMAWVVQFDTATDADEFAAVARRFVDRRAADSPLAFDARRAGDDAVVLLAGPERFVANTTVARTGETVTVAAP